MPTSKDLPIITIWEPINLNINHINKNATPKPQTALNNKFVLTTGPAWNKPVNIIVPITAIPNPQNTTSESYCVIQPIKPLSVFGFTIVFAEAILFFTLFLNYFFLSLFLYSRIYLIYLYLLYLLYFEMFLLPK